MRTFQGYVRNLMGTTHFQKNMIYTKTINGKVIKLNFSQLTRWYTNFLFFAWGHSKRKRLGTAGVVGCKARIKDGFVKCYACFLSNPEC